MFFRISIFMIVLTAGSLAVAAPPSNEDCAKRIDLTEELAKPIFSRYLKAKLDSFYKELYRDAADLSLPDDAITHYVSFKRYQFQKNNNGVYVETEIQAGEYTETFHALFQSSDWGPKGNPRVEVLRDSLRRTVGYKCVSMIALVNAYGETLPNYNPREFGVSNSEYQSVGSIILDEVPYFKIEKPW